MANLLMVNLWDFSHESFRIILYSPRPSLVSFILVCLFRGVGRRAAKTPGASTPILSLTNIEPNKSFELNLVWYILKFQHISSKRQSRWFLMKLFLVAKSFLIQFCLFCLYDFLLSLFFSLIFAIFHNHLQSDTIYSPGRPLIYAPVSVRTSLKLEFEGCN